MRTLPEILEDAADAFTDTKNVFFFDYSSFSGKFFDGSMLHQGFSIYFAKTKLKLNISSKGGLESVTLNKNSVLVVPGVYSVKIDMDNSVYFKLSLVVHTLRFVESIKGELADFTRECHSSSSVHQSLLGMYYNLAMSSKKSDKLNQFRTVAIMVNLVAEMIYFGINPVKNDFESGKSRESFARLAEYVKENYMRPFDTQQVSDSLQLTVQYLNHLSNEFRGLSLKNMVNLYRLEKSRELLQDTDQSISEVAEGSGFNAVAYYIRLFKKNYNLSPLQCRKLLRLKSPTTEQTETAHRIVDFVLVEASNKIPEITFEPVLKVTMCIANATNETLVVSWLNPLEPEVEMYRLKPGKRIHMGTGFGECWTIRSENGSLIGYYSVPDCCCQIIVQKV